MPANLIDVLTYTTPIVVPADGDAEGAASVVAAFQGLTNRTALANDALATSGVTLLRHGSAATMAALVMASGQSGQVFLVDGAGLYRYINPSALTADSNWVYTAAGAASGQWVYESNSFLNQNLGVPTIGPQNGNGAAANRLAKSVVPYGITGTPFFNGAQGSMTTTAGAPAALTGSPTINLGSLNVGDIVELSAPAAYVCTGTAIIEAVFSENGAGYASAGLNFTYAASTGAAAHLSFIRTVAVAGTYLIQIWGASAGAATLTVTAPVLYARAYRP